MLFLWFYRRENLGSINDPDLTYVFAHRTTAESLWVLVSSLVTLSSRWTVLPVMHTPRLLNQLFILWWMWFFFFFLVGKSGIHAVSTVVKEFPISTNAVFSKLWFNLGDFCHLNVRWMWILKIILCKNKGSSVHKGTYDPFVSCILLTREYSWCTCSAPGTVLGCQINSCCIR